MWLAGKGQMEKGREVRRGQPIHIYVGWNGDGKSLTAIWDTLPTLEAGRPVLSTVRLVDYLDPRPCEGWESVITGWSMLPDQTWRPSYGRRECVDPYHGLDGHLQAHPLYIRFTDWLQLLEWRFGDVLMDEVTGVADASDWASVPSSIVNKFPQMRRDECTLRITTLSFANCNKRIRQAALAVTRCTGQMPAGKNSEFGKGRVYRPRRLITHKTLDAKTIPQDDPSMAAYDKARIINRSRLWVPDCIARLAYDTYHPVDTVATTNDAGTCLHCGGTRRRQECHCPEYVAGKGERKAIRAQAASAASTDAGRSTGRHATGPAA